MLTKGDVGPPSHESDDCWRNEMFRDLDWLDPLPFFCLFLLAVGGLAGLAGLGSAAYTNYQCSNYQKVTGKETKYVLFDTCYVQTADGFQRWDEYKIRAAASEGLVQMHGQ